MNALWPFKDGYLLRTQKNNEGATLGLVKLIRQRKKPLNINSYTFLQINLLPPCIFEKPHKNVDERLMYFGERSHIMVAIFLCTYIFNHNRTRYESSPVGKLMCQLEKLSSVKKRTKGVQKLRRQTRKERTTCFAFPEVKQSVSRVSTSQPTYNT